MYSKSSFAGLALACLVPSAWCYNTHLSQWFACPFEEALRNAASVTSQFECANFTVPLDYLDEKSNKTITLQLSRVPATNGESQGTIFFNFGGPGLEARFSLVSQSEHILAITEGKFDLVAFDPRGVGQTEPFNCYNDTERTVTRLKQRLTDVGGPEDESLLARSWASMKSYATDCLTSDESAPDIAEVIGTGYVARDLMLMVDSIVGNGCLLNFWGLSYGTVLGTTVSALFPDRIGRVVLDGNVNIPEYYHGFELEWFRDADAAVFDFFERCTDAGPELCQLAGRNESARILNGRFYEALDALRTAPIPMGTTFVLDQTALKTGLRIALYGTESFPQLAATFDELFKSEKDRNSTALAEAWLPLATASDLGDTLPDDSATGIFCGDKTIRTEEFGDVFPDMTKRFRAVSRSLGDMANGLSFPCLRWPWHAKGGYNGSWHDEVETKNPILFIGNTYDPVTPISNAHNSSAIFTGSSVLENGGVGHGSFAHSSRCTAKVIRAYFNEGKLPERGLKCEADFGAFEPGKSWKDYMLPESDYV